MFRAVALFCLALVTAACRPALPPLIQDEMAATPRGHATVVFFTDFQCPFCRRTHLALEPLVAERKGRVRVVYRHVPLRRHPDARTAARAAICVEQIAPDILGTYAHALVTANDLSEGAVVAIAHEMKVDRDAFERCTHDSKTEERIERDEAMFDALDGDGVPLLYVGRARLDGAQTRSSLEAALDSALESEK